MSKHQRDSRMRRHAYSAHRGVMLVFALFFIVVATSLATLIMAGSAQLIRTTRHEHEAILVQQLTDSGRAWVLANKDRRLIFPVTLNGEQLLPEGISGDVQVNSEKECLEVLVITATIRLSGHSLSRTIRFRNPS